MRIPTWINELKHAVEISFCRSDVLRFLKLDTNGSGNHRTVQKWIDELKLDTTHFDSNKAKGARKTNIQQTNRFVNGSVLTIKDKNQLKNIIKYECSICMNNGVHMEKPLVLQLDHIDGNHRNNTIDNLRWLCPNCHTQTPTYGSKRLKKTKIKKSQKNPLWRNDPRPSTRKVERPSKEELQELLKTESMVSVGKKYGVTDNAVRKWLKYYNVI